MNTIPVWQADTAGFYLYPATANELAAQPGDYNIPFGAYTDEPTAAPEGYVNRRIDGAWHHVEDHRSDALYLVGTGVKYQIGATVEVGVDQVSYDGGGPIPDWLTIEPVVPDEVEIEGETVEPAALP